MGLNEDEVPQTLSATPRSRCSATHFAAGVKLIGLRNAGSSLLISRVFLGQGQPHQV